MQEHTIHIFSKKVFAVKECDMSFRIHGCSEVPAPPVMDCKQ